MSIFNQTGGGSSLDDLVTDWTGNVADEAMDISYKISNNWLFIYGVVYSRDGYKYYKEADLPSDLVGALKKTKGAHGYISSGRTNSYGTYGYLKIYYDNPYPIAIGTSSETESTTVSVFMPIY